jgi:hypothetical protein
MKQRANNSRYRRIQALFVGLAIFALLFMATESTLAHHHAGGSDAACPVCHIAHHAPIKSATVVKAPVLVLVAHGVLCEVRTPELELIVSEHPSRAPPSA